MARAAVLDEDVSKFELLVLLICVVLNGCFVYQEMVTLMEGLHEAEENILECLGSGHRLLYNLSATKKLASIKKQHEEIVEGCVFSLHCIMRDSMSLYQSAASIFVLTRAK